MGSLVEHMRVRTAVLHSQAERSGVIAAILAGKVSPELYGLYLRNLLPAYQEMEGALRRHPDSALSRGLDWAPLLRADWIVADLRGLAGPDWSRRLPLLESGAAYAARVAEAATPPGARLIAHAYTRYLGDLSGGQILRRRLGATIAATSFLEFPGLADTAKAAADIRAALDSAGTGLSDLETVVDEATIAFQLNIQLSHDVAATVGRVVDTVGAPPRA